MTQKQKYIAFLHQQYVPVFYQPWYLDAVCDSQWDVVVEELDGKIIGAMTYMIKKKYGLRYIIHPRLCPYMGPLFFGDTDEHEVYQRMIAQLPRHHYREQKYSPALSGLNLPNTLHNRITYILSSASHSDLDMSMLSSKLRGKIRKAAKIFTRRENVTIEELLTFVDQTFGKRGRPNPFHRDTVRAIDTAAGNLSSRSIVAYRDQAGQDMAMGYFLEDEYSVYNLVTAVDNSQNHNAVSLMLWETASSAIHAGKSFDFEGSNIPAIERLYQSFGGDRVICPSTSYASNRIIAALVDLKTRKSRST